MTHRKVRRPPGWRWSGPTWAAWLADAEVTSEHVLLALTGRWRDSCCARLAGALQDPGGCGTPAADRRHRGRGTASRWRSWSHRQRHRCRHRRGIRSSWHPTRSATIHVGGNPGARGDSESRWTRRPSREAGPANTSSTATATPYSPSTAGRCTSLWTRTPTQCWTSTDGKCSAGRDPPRRHADHWTRPILTQAFRVATWNGPASGPRGGSLVLPPRPGWRSGRTVLACPTPSRKRSSNQAAPEPSPLGS